MPKNRSRSEIMYDILCSIDEDKGSMKTFLLYKATLSYNQMKQYLEELTRLGMIEHNPDTGKYYIRERGTKYCSIYKRLSEELNKE